MNAGEVFPEEEGLHDVDDNYTGLKLCLLAAVTAFAILVGGITYYNYRYTQSVENLVAKGQTAAAAACALSGGDSTHGVCLAVMSEVTARKNKTD